MPITLDLGRSRHARYEQLRQHARDAGEDLGSLEVAMRLRDEITAHDGVICPVDAMRFSDTHGPAVHYQDDVWVLVCVCGGYAFQCEEDLRTEGATPTDADARVWGLLAESPMHRGGMTGWTTEVDLAATAQERAVAAQAARDDYRARVARGGIIPPVSDPDGLPF